MKFSDINEIMSREVGGAEMRTLERKKPVKVSAQVRKAVLMYLAIRENSDGSGAYPSKSRIARELELSRRSVQLAIDTLQQTAGNAPPLIERIGTRRTRKGPVDVFRINMVAVGLLPKVKRDDDEVEIVTPEVRTEFTSGVNDIHSKGERGSQVGVNEVHTEPHTEPQNNQKKTKPLGSQQKQADEEQDDAALLHSFIKAYPKNGEPTAILRAWQTVIGRGHNPREIIAGAERLKLAAAANPSRQFRLPHLWLHREGWTDVEPEDDSDQTTEAAE